MNREVAVRTVRLGAIVGVVVGCVLMTAARAHDDSSSGAAKSKSTSHSASASPNKSKAHKTSARRHKKSSKVRGQMKIDSERAQEIQEALIREHYLKGEATGKWDEATQAALRRYQADNGWQSKLVPDSRALIKLGLGPSKDHLLNPESAMTTVPDAPKAETAPPISHSTTPAADSAAPSTPPTTPASSTASGPQ
jgi:peptidoglycan hydrolase-like protein with peptidoglycan-binding domain